MKWEAPLGGSADAIGVVLGPVREGLSPPRRALRVTAGCEARGRSRSGPVPSGGCGRGEDRREASALPGSGAASGRLGVMGERE